MKVLLIINIENVYEWKDFYPSLCFRVVRKALIWHFFSLQRYSLILVIFLVPFYFSGSREFLNWNFWADQWIMFYYLDSFLCSARARSLFISLKRCRSKAQGTWGRFRNTLQTVSIWYAFEAEPGNLNKIYFLSHLMKLSLCSGSNTWDRQPVRMYQFLLSPSNVISTTPPCLSENNQ